jgi:hypothetical protein
MFNIFLNKLLINSIRNLKGTVGLNAVNVIARQDRNAHALLAEIALGARLQTLLATHILKATDLREKALHVRNRNQYD